MKTVAICLALLGVLASSVWAGPFVTQVLIFSGEVASNLTPGAPLSVSSTGKVTTGLVSQEVTSATASSCTTTDGILNSMTFTPGVASTWLAIFGADFSSANAGTIVTLEFDLSGTYFPNSQRKFMPFAGGTLTSGSQRIQQGLNSIITVTSTQAIEVHCQTSASTVSTASMQLDLVRIN